MSKSRKRKLRRRIRERMEKTGESYRIARMHILNADAKGKPPAGGLETPRLTVPLTLADHSRSTKLKHEAKPSEWRRQRLAKLKARLKRALVSLFPAEAIQGIVEQIQEALQQGVGLASVNPSTGKSSYAGCSRRVPHG